MELALKRTSQVFLVISKLADIISIVKRHSYKIKLSEFFGMNQTAQSMWVIRTLQFFDLI